MTYFSSQELAAIKNDVKPKAPAKPTGRGGFITSLISEGGGFLGGLAGIPLGPAGIAAGAALGGTVGRGIEDKVRNDQNFFGKGGSAKEALTEGAISGVTAGGPVKLLKGAKGAAKGIAKGASAAETTEVKRLASKGIPVKFSSDELTGKGVTKTTKKTLTNPTIGDLGNELSSMTDQGYKVSQRLGKTPGSKILGIERQITPDFTPVSSSPKLSSVELTGRKTDIPLSESKQLERGVINTPDRYTTDTVETAPARSWMQNIIGSANEAMGVPSAAKGRAGSFLENLTTQGQAAQGRVLGISGGSKIAGRELTPQDTERLLSTVKREGISTGNANNALRDVKGKLDIYGKQINDHFKTHSAPLHPEDTRTIADNFVSGLKTTDPAVIKEAEILANDLQKNVKNTKDLWKFRVGLDSRIPDSKFTDAATSNKITAIKEMRDYIAKELGDIPGARQYHDLSEIKPFVSAEARRLNNPGGGIVGRVLASGPAQKLESTAGKVAEKVGKAGTNQAVDTMAPGPRNLAARILAGRGVDNAMQLASPEAAAETATEAPANTEGQQAQAVTAQDILDKQAAEGNQDTDPYSPANIQTAVKNIIAQGGTQKDVAEFLANAKAVGELSALGGGSAKPVSATAADAIANAQAGLTSLDQIEQELSKNPSVQGKEAITQTFNPFGITGKVTGTSNYDTAITQAKDVIARLRTGAAISNSEESRFTKMLPQPADPPETVKRKIELLRNALTTVVQRVGGNSQDLIQEAAANP